MRDQDIHLSNNLQAWDTFIRKLDNVLLYYFSGSEDIISLNDSLMLLKKSFFICQKVLLVQLESDSRRIYIENEYTIVKAIFKTLNDYSPGLQGSHTYLKELMTRLKKLAVLRRRIKG